jgi:hypothetical protein
VTGGDVDAGNAVAGALYPLDYSHRFFDDHVPILCPAPAPRVWCWVFAAFMVPAICWTLNVGIMALAPPETGFIWLNIKYFWIAITPVALFLFVLNYTGRDTGLKKWHTRRPVCHPWPYPGDGLDQQPTWPDDSRSSVYPVGHPHLHSAADLWSVLLDSHRLQLHADLAQRCFCCGINHSQLISVPVAGYLSG